MVNKACASGEVINAAIEEEMDMLLEPENNEEDHKVIAIEVHEDDIVDLKQAEKMSRKLLVNCDRLGLDPYAQRLCHRLGREFSNAKAIKSKQKTFVTNHFKLSPKKKAGGQGDKSGPSDNMDCDYTLSS